jgi:hypothetical protein
MHPFSYLYGYTTAYNTSFVEFHFVVKLAKLSLAFIRMFPMRTSYLMHIAQGCQ